MSSIAQWIIAEAQRQGLDPSLALEVANAESGMNPNVGDGSAGEIGIYQILPVTGAGLGFSAAQLRDPQSNIQAGVSYLRQLVGKFGDPAAALAAYNWGPSRMDANLAQNGSNWFAHIPASTQSYINKILGNVQSAYTPSLTPLPFPTPIPAGVDLTPAGPTSELSLWTQVAIAVAVIFGISFLMSE
jgi:soluble lytic murein transglycosylase-like protein